MPVHVEIGESTCSPEFTPLIEDTASAALGHQGASAQAVISIVISDDAQLLDLNRQFRGIDAPTDVLSFPADFTDPESGAAYLGDVVISYPRVVAQAQSGGHTPEAELQLLIVHGVLHLLGYDHGNDEDKAAMWAAQSEILNALDIAISPP